MVLSVIMISHRLSFDNRPNPHRKERKMDPNPNDGDLVVMRNGACDYTKAIRQLSMEGIAMDPPLLMSGMPEITTSFKELDHEPTIIAHGLDQSTMGTAGVISKLCTATPAMHQFPDLRNVLWPQDKAALGKVIGTLSDDHTVSWQQLWFDLSYGFELNWEFALWTLQAIMAIKLQFSQPNDRILVVAHEATMWVLMALEESKRTGAKWATTFPKAIETPIGFAEVRKFKL